MQVFRGYMKLLKKSIPNLLLFIGIMLTTIAISPARRMNIEENTFEVTKIHIGFVDNQKGKEIVIPYLKEYLKGYCDFIAIGKSSKDIEDALFIDKVDYVLTIDKDFEQKFLLGEDVALNVRAVPGSDDSYMVNQLVNNFLNTFRQYQHVLKGESVENLCKLTMDTVKETATANLVADKERVYVKEYNASFFNFLTYVLVAGLMTGVGYVMVTFNNIHIKRRNIVSPVSNQSMNFQMILANFIFAVLYLFVTIVFGMALGPGGGDSTSLGFHIMNAFVFMLGALGMGYIVGMAIKKINIVSAITTIVSLGLAFISGSFVPQQYLGDTVISLAKFTPSYWYVLANNRIGEITTFTTKNTQEIVGIMGIELLFAIALFSVAIVVSRQRRQLTE